MTEDEYGLPEGAIAGQRNAPMLVVAEPVGRVKAFEVSGKEVPKCQDTPRPLHNPILFDRRKGPPALMGMAKTPTARPANHRKSRSTDLHVLLFGRGES